MTLIIFNHKKQGLDILHPYGIFDTYIIIQFLKTCWF